MSIRRNSVGLPTKGLAERNHDCSQNDNMVVKNRVTGGHGGSVKDECRNNEYVDKQDADRIEAQAFHHSRKQQRQQQQPQVPRRPAVHWENFLPVQSLKVLLVENDDSTRHAVSALLRNCSYEVTAVSDGLEAWKILEDLTNHVDLVLTEVATPCLSGIDLLSKIMSDKNCKNIPVIMMSSNDSMNVVFKCLSNGAVDFLVKPIRKNELKNLWQHVWRKCHGSSGSGSGIQTNKPMKSTSVDGSNDNSDSNCEEGNGSTGLIYRNGSDNDSGTQSCSRRALEVHSKDDLATPPESTCAQVIHSRPETKNSNSVPANATRMFQIEGNEHDVAMGKDLTLGAPTNTDLQLRNPSAEVLSKVSSSGVGKLIDLDMRKDEKRQGKDIVEHIKETTKDDIKHKDNDAKVSKTNVSISCGRSAQNELPNDAPKVSKVKHMNPYDKRGTALGLQRPRDIGSSGTNAQEHNILRQSDNSAFSRYTTTSKNNRALTGNAGSFSSVNGSLEAANTESMERLQRKLSGTPNQGSNGSSNNFNSSTTNYVSDSLEAAKTESMERLQSKLSGTPNQGSNGSSNTNYVSDSLEAAKTESMERLQSKLSGTPNQGSNGSSNNFNSSTTNHVTNKPESPIDKSISRSTVSVHNCYTSQPVQHSHCPSVQTMMPGIPDTAKIVATQVTDMQPPSQVKHHHHHHYHHHHHHVHSLQQQQLPLNSDDLSSRNSIDATPHCGISDKLEMAIEENAANYESASGSTDGHHGQNGNSIGGIIEGTNVGCDSGAPSACVTGGGNRSAIDQDRLALREAALIKFRQKRKERCFEKKVRYQSRKKLAEQRPRVRGQFVRQPMDENKTKGESS